MGMYFLWTPTMFPIMFPINTNDAFFSQMYIMEFLTFAFVRTRTSIKYLAKLICIMNVIFLVYLNSYLYPASAQLVTVVFVADFALLFYFLGEFEVPALLEWNPFARETPSEASPRAGYHLVLNDASFGLGFNLWHIFVPLRFRNSFTLAEQTEFDRLSALDRYGIDYSPRPPNDVPAPAAPADANLRQRRAP